MTVIGERGGAMVTTRTLSFDAAAISRDGIRNFIHVSSCAPFFR